MIESFFYKLGLMTARNHTELLQAVKSLQVAVETMTDSIENLTAHIDELSNVGQSRHEKVLENISDLTANVKANYFNVKNEFDKQSKNLDAVEELLKLSLVNQIMASE